MGDQLFESKYKRSLQTHLLNPQGLNSYAYANNNPLKYSDPDGEILPVILLAAWAIAEVGMSAYDVYDTVTTLVDSNASLGDKGLATGGMLLGIVLPGGGYGKASKEFVEHGGDVIRGVGRLGEALGKNVPKPKVSDKLLQENYIDQLFKPSDRLIGGTAEAIRYSKKTGELIGGSKHVQKGRDVLVGLQNWLTKNTNAVKSDILKANQVMNDLKDALKMK